MMIIAVCNKSVSIAPKDRKVLGVIMTVNFTNCKYFDV